MPELVFFSGTMDCGKSTLALQIVHNRTARGLQAVIFTRDDRAGHGRLSSRLGLVTDAVEVTDGMDLFGHLVALVSRGGRADYVVIDEAQFLAPEQIDQSARIVDELGLDVYAFGITTDFRSRLFPGSRRLIELADRVEALQVEALCWCGARATHNARTVDGVMVVEGAQVVIGDVDNSANTVSAANAANGVNRVDTAGAANTANGARTAGEVGYEVLCRRHHTRRMTSANARAAALSPDVLPVTPA